MPVIKLSFCKNFTILFVYINLVNLTYFDFVWEYSINKKYLYFCNVNWLNRLLKVKIYSFKIQYLLNIRFILIYLNK